MIRWVLLLPWKGRAVTRGRSWRRAQRERVIANRLRMIAQSWGWRDSQFEYEPGRLHKYNTACPCMMCRLDKHGRRRVERRSRDAMKATRRIKKTPY